MCWCEKADIWSHKEDILNEVWADSFVEENNLDKSIYAIRQALGEKPGEQKYIETVRKHGYRFVAEVRRVELSEPSAVVNGLKAAESKIEHLKFQNSEDQRPQTKDRKQNPQSKIQNPKSRR